MRRSLRVIIAVVAAAAIVGLWSTAAEAHVVAKITTAADGTSTVTFQFFHGCGTNQPTTSLKVKLPDGTTDVTPTSAPAGFQGAVNGTELSWTGASVPYNQEASFVATMRLPGKQGETIFLPTVQACAGGDEPWLEKTTDPEAPAAAPRVVLTQTVDTVTTTAAPTTTASTTTTAAPTTTATPGTTAGTNPTIPASTNSNTSGAIVFFVVCAILVVGALLIFLRRPNRPSRQPDADEST